MPLDSEDHQRESSPWYLGLIRAVPAIVIAIWITFSADHSPQLGLLAFGIFALVSGLGIGVLAITRLERGTPRLVLSCQAVTAIVTGAAAVAVTGGGYAYFVLILSAYAAITGFLDLYLGARSRRRSAASRDWMFVGGLSVALAVVALVLPASFAQPYAVEGVEGVVTASVALVGGFGAYLAVLGVYLVIAALSLKWSNEQPVGRQSPSNSNTVGV